MKSSLKKQSFVLFFIALLAVYSCDQSKKADKEGDVGTELIIPKDIKWSERLARSVMKRDSVMWQVDHYPEPKWSYKHGLLGLAFLKLYDKTGNDDYLNFVLGYGDSMIDSSGGILNYEIEDYNIDNINAGKLLFDLYKHTDENRYLSALKTLRKQLEGHPRTPSGGFWHKKIYPNQMWLDGLYMGAPFYIQYNTQYENGNALDDIALQFDLIQEHTLDDTTGLLYHAWDESRKMDWANKETGLSPNFWSRSMGWYAMALVDVLDYFPEEHPKHKDLVNYLNQLAEALVAVQDDSGLWYQVPNMGGKEGNYLEASGTEMFAYAFAKGVKKGYLPEKYMESAQKAFDGLIEETVVIDEDGEIHISQICGSAGLGGNPYRDGSFEYYIGEKIETDDLHGLGPFILAALELNR